MIAAIFKRLSALEREVRSLRPTRGPGTLTTRRPHGTSRMAGKVPRAALIEGKTAGGHARWG
jgi:hypothetical protein